ncbi:MAG: hypothetical protein LAP40_14010 [Acidobacteriia bacterium]|nr:hypothetical protein [Terriglobia bacterium]
MGYTAPFMTCLRLAVALAALTAPLAAQWLDHPTPGVPRTKDGKPNLSAPAPRTREGRPDLSGVWYLETPPCGPGCGGLSPLWMRSQRRGRGSSCGSPPLPEFAIARARSRAS